MIFRSLTTLSAMALLAGCANSPDVPPDFAAKNRPLEERCVRAQSASRKSQPGMTQSEIQAEAKKAASRGELDKACDWL